MAANVIISKIQHRTGADSVLPQLDVGEFGFSTDARRLYIGNDPVLYPVNRPTNDTTETEVLTEYSPIKMTQIEGSSNLSLDISNPHDGEVFAVYIQGPVKKMINSANMVYDRTTSTLNVPITETQIGINSNAQPNIHTVGNLTTLTVDGNTLMKSDANINGNLFVGGNTVLSGALAIGSDLGVAGNISGAKNISITGNSSVSGNSSITGNLAVSGNSSITGNLDVSGNSSITGNLDLTGNLDVSGDSLVAGNSSITGNLDVSGSSSITGNLDLTGNLDVSGSSSIDGNLDVSGNSSIAGNLDVSGNSSITGSLAVDGDSSVTGNLSVSIDVDIIGNLLVQSFTELSDTLITGNLVVNGNTINTNVTSVTVADPILAIGGANGGGNLIINDGKDRGILMQYFDGAAKNAFIGLDNGPNDLIFAKSVDVIDEFVTVSEYANVKANVVLSQVANGTPVIVTNSTTLNANLNADMVDGLHIHTLVNNEPNKLVRTDGDGSILAGMISTSSNNAGLVSPTRIYASYDSNIRYYNPTNFKEVISVPDRDGTNATGTWNIDIIGTATNVEWANVSGKPTTLAGYAITDVQPLDADLTAIAAISDSGTGLLKKTGANTWVLMDATETALPNTVAVRDSNSKLLSLGLSTGATSTAGSITGQWTLTSGSTLQSTYADLAEYYSSDADYASGTIVSINTNGDSDVTESMGYGNTNVLGIVSTDPAYKMNGGLSAMKACVALTGRVPCKVVGKINKGDMIVSSHINGVGTSDANPKFGSVVGKALSSYDSAEVGFIEVFVVRF